MRRPAGSPGAWRPGCGPGAWCSERPGCGAMDLTTFASESAASASRIAAGKSRRWAMSIRAVVRGAGRERGGRGCGDAAGAGRGPQTRRPGTGQLVWCPGCCRGGCAESVSGDAVVAGGQSGGVVSGAGVSGVWAGRGGGRCGVGCVGRGCGWGQLTGVGWGWVRRFSSSVWTRAPRASVMSTAASTEGTTTLGRTWRSRAVTRWGRSW